MKNREDELNDEFGDDEEEDDLPVAEPEGTTDLVTVAQARNMKEAKAMKSILESAEITAFIGQGETTEQQEAPVGPGIPVLVPEELAVEAEEILAEAAMGADDEEDFDDDDFDEEWDVEEAEEDEDYLDDDDLDDLEDEDDDDDLDDVEDFDDEDDDRF